MSIAEQVKRLEDENASLQEDYTKLRDMLERQASNFREHLAMRNQQLVDAAAALKDAEDKIVNKDGEILYLTNRLARFQLARDVLNGAQHGESPFDRKNEQMSFFQQLPARAN